MILQALHALYGRLQADPAYALPTPGYSLQKITFKVILEPNGRLFTIEDHRLERGGKRRPRQLQVLGAGKPSGSGLNPCLLWDNSTYMLGFKPEDTKPRRTAESFEAFRTKHLALETEINAASFSAVCRFLEAWEPARAIDDFPHLAEIATGFGVYQLRGQPAYIHQDPAVKAWWRQQADTAADGDTGQCLITGDEGPIARLHPKIRGVTGAQGAGATLAGFNDDAYTSYGKSQSFNAPVSEDAAFRYTAALNALLDGPMRDKHRLSLGDATVVFWTEQPTVTEEIFALWFTNSRDSAAMAEETQDQGLRLKIEVFLTALRSGEDKSGPLGEDSAATRYYILGLAPNAARLAVRFFHQGTLGELLRHLRRHLRDISLTPQPAVGKRRADPEMPPAWLLLRQTARDSKDIPPVLAGPLLRAIVTGSLYPQGLYAAVLRRIYADREVSYLRVCVLKGYLNRNQNQEVSMSLDPERTEPGYLIGRLFAVLEKAQNDAHGGKLNKTIRDNFYSSASATPRSVFPRLLRTYQHHLAKLGIGHKIFFEKKVQTIVAPLADWPAHLDMTGQGLFAIGYYHQTRDLYSKHDPQDAPETSSEG